MGSASNQSSAHRSPSETVGTFLVRLRNAPDCAGQVLLALIAPIARAVFRARRLPTDLTEDAVQDGVVRALANDSAALRRADPATHLAAWLRGLMHNLAREEVRRRRRSHRPAHPSEGVQSTGRSARRQRRSVRALGLSKFVTTLTIKQREAFDLHLAGLSAREVGERLGVSREAAQERVDRAWRALRRAEAARVQTERAVLPTLSKDQRNALSARTRTAYEAWTAGATYEDIARRLGCTRSAARGVLRRLRRASANSKSCPQPLGPSPSPENS